MKDIKAVDVRDIKRITHNTLDRVTKDISEERQFNTAVARLMELTNALISFKPRTPEAWAVMKEGVETLLSCLSPFAPHITEELWHNIGNETFLSVEKWFEVDPESLAEDEVTVVLQINGKVREQFTVKADLSGEDLQKEILSRPQTLKRIEGKEIIKIIPIPGKLVNIVVKG
jgi:leucyl-tRNA synthetase